jgi:hypothetical protein
VWQIKELQADFADVWQAKDLAGTFAGAVEEQVLIKGNAPGSKKMCLMGLHAAQSWGSLPQIP